VVNRSLASSTFKVGFQVASPQPSIPSPPLYASSRLLTTSQTHINHRQDGDSNFRPNARNRPDPDAPRSAHQKHRSSQKRHLARPTNAANVRHPLSLPQSNPPHHRASIVHPEHKLTPHHSDSIQVHSTILAQNLKAITEHLSKHADLFASTVVYPSTNFPGRTQENLVGQLLRKKLEPNVETWVEEGRALGSQKAEGRDAGEEDLDELWNFAKAYVTPAVAKAAQGSRDMLDDIYNESSEEEEEEEEKEGEAGEQVVAGGHVYGDGGKGNPEGLKRDLDAIARFMTTGVVR